MGAMLPRKIMENIENIEIILSLAASAVGFIISTVTFAVKYVKSRFAKTEATDRLQIRDVLLGFIVEAEKTVGISGEDKKKYVMECIKKFAETNNVSFSETRVSKKIDEIVALAKVVNTVVKVGE
jgi:hypothetical protein